MPANKGIGMSSLKSDECEILTLTVGTLIPHSSLSVGFPNADHSRFTSNRAMESALSKKPVFVMFTVS